MSSPVIDKFSPKAVCVRPLRQINHSTAENAMQGKIKTIVRLKSGTYDKKTTKLKQIDDYRQRSCL